MQQIAKTHIAEKFRPHPVSNTVYHFGAVICRIDIANTDHSRPSRVCHGFYRWQKRYLLILTPPQ